ncbi:DoxX family protein [Patescibacteria group bacterium]|nr:DoxX family protein [Patescibacteria group bacterium]
MFRFHKGCFGTLILRLVVGAIFLQWGLVKLMMNGDAINALISGTAITPTWFWIAAVVQTVGGVLLILGLATRFAAVILGLLMLMILNSQGRTFGPSQLEYLMLGTLVSLVFMGGKRYSFDRLICGSRCETDHKHTH